MQKEGRGGLVFQGREPRAQWKPGPFANVSGEAARNAEGADALLNAGWEISNTSWVY